MIQFVDKPQEQTPYYQFKKDGITAKIVPSLGGSLQELTKNSIPIITGSLSSVDSEATYLKYCASGIMFPFPNRLEKGQFTHENISWQLPLNDEQRHAIHGCVFQKPLEVKTLTETKITLGYTHTQNSEFPFSFTLDVTYEFKQTGITIHFRVKNNSSSSFPYGIGWHPYFALTERTKSSLQLDAHIQYLTNDELICNAQKEVEITNLSLNQTLDSAFALSSQNVTLQTESYRITLATPKKSYLQLYTPQDKDMVAIEPMSCIGNAFNSGIGKKILAPEESFTWQVELDIETFN